MYPLHLEVENGNRRRSLRRERGLHQRLPDPGVLRPLLRSTAVREAFITALVEGILRGLGRVLEPRRAWHSDAVLRVVVL